MTRLMAKRSPSPRTSCAAGNRRSFCRHCRPRSTRRLESPVRQRSCRASIDRSARNPRASGTGVRKPAFRATEIECRAAGRVRFNFWRVLPNDGIGRAKGFAPPSSGRSICFEARGRDAAQRRNPECANLQAGSEAVRLWDIGAFIGADRHDACRHTHRRVAGPVRRHRRQQLRGAHAGKRCAGMVRLRDRGRSPSGAIH